jgi:DNA-binding Lrp family transcriptional regulator
LAYFFGKFHVKFNTLQCNIPCDIAISEQIKISEGTIYPLLKRVKDDGYVTTYLLESQEGPPFCSALENSDVITYNITNRK